MTHRIKWFLAEFPFMTIVVASLKPGKWLWLGCAALVVHAVLNWLEGKGERL